MHASATGIEAATEAPETANEWVSAGERQEAARQAYRQSIASGRPLTGVALGELFGLSARWGTERTAEVRAEMAAALRNGNGAGEPGVVRHLPIGKHTTRPHAADPAHDADHGGSHPAATAEPAAGQHPVATPAHAVRQAAGGPDQPPVRRQSGAAQGPHAAKAASRAGWERHALAAGKAAVRLVAAALSYEHMRTVAEAAGETGWRALLLPISVDGLAVLALVTMRAQRRDGLRPTAWAWAALALALAASLAANVASAEPTLAGRLVAAWPPVALFLAEVMDRPSTPD